MYAKLVLLVDDNQTQPGKCHVTLKQGMGTDYHVRSAAGDKVQLLLAFLAFEFAR